MSEKTVDTILATVVDYEKLQYPEMVEAESIILKSFVRHHKNTLIPLLELYVKGLNCEQVTGNR